MPNHSFYPSGAARDRLALLLRSWPWLLLILVGCGQSPYALSPGAQVAANGQQTLIARNTELQSRANALDQSNQQLQSLLAQSQQKTQILNDEVVALRDQLRGLTNQLAQSRSEKEGLEKRTQAMAASVRNRPGARIQANNSLISRLTVIHLPGINVRQDGDVVRIELPGDQLFHRGGATLKPGAAQLIDAVAADIRRSYPQQRIGIEGHTDSDPMSTAEFPSNHHLSLSRATAVYDELTQRLHFAPQQLFVIGHGANHPIVSNATAAGKARNRRVELVIYPETYSPN